MLSKLRALRNAILREAGILARFLTTDTSELNNLLIPNRQEALPQTWEDSVNELRSVL